MTCSPSTLFVDQSVWSLPGLTDSIKKSYLSLSEGEAYDCGLTSVPCESNLTKALTNMDPTLTFWFDLLVVYTGLTMSFVFGFFGNVLNIIIFSTNNIVSDSTNNLILALSVSDLINVSSIGEILTFCFACLIDEATALTISSSVFSQIIIFTRWFSLLSLDFVLVITIQRSVAVILPFKIATIFSRRNTNIIIIVLCVICICTIIPLITTIYPVRMFHPYFQKDIYLGGYNALGLLVTTRYIFNYLIFRSGFNLFATFAIGLITVHMLNRHAKNRASLTADKSTSQTSTPNVPVREIKAIKMSLAICFVTFTFYSISIAVNGVSQVYVEELFRSPFSSMSEYTLLMLVAVNSSFNFLLYLRMSDKYREAVYTIFSYPCKKWRGE